MNNPSEGTTAEGLTWKRARLCDVFTGLVNAHTWRWFLYNKRGQYLRNFATRRELEWFSAHRGHLCGTMNVAEFERK